METEGSISAAEASAALASAQQSRTRVAWAGYPAWYWLSTAVILAAMPIMTMLPLLAGLAGCVVLGALGTVLAVVAGRARGVCEEWTRPAMRWRDVAVLYGPTVVVITAGGLMSRLVWWVPVTAAVLGFALFAGTGLALSARATRR